MSDCYFVKIKTFKICVSLLYVLIICFIYLKQYFIFNNILYDINQFFDIIN